MNVITYILIDILSSCDLMIKLLTFRKENYEKMKKALSFNKIYVNRFRNLAKFLVEKNETNLLFSLLTYKKLKRILKENSDFSSLDLNKLKKEILEEKLGAILMFKQFKHNSIKLKYFKFNTFYGGGDG